MASLDIEFLRQQLKIAELKQQIAELENESKTEVKATTKKASKKPSKKPSSTARPVQARELHRLTTMIPAMMSGEAVKKITGEHITGNLVHSVTDLKSAKGVKCPKGMKIVVITLNNRLDYSPETKQGKFLESVKNIAHGDSYKLVYKDLKDIERTMQFRLLTKKNTSSAAEEDTN